MIAAVATTIGIGCEPSSPRDTPAPSPAPVAAYGEQDDLVSATAREPPSSVAGFPPRSVIFSEETDSGLASWRIENAAVTDSEYASDDPVPARRYVYRVELVLPATLGVDRSVLAASAAELFVDVSAERLRARFVGPGWPVEAGSEVRIRGDSQGAYLFDRHGGRSIAPGALAEWFDGGPRNRRGPPLVIRQAPLHPGPRPPGALVCALLAEWAGEPRDNVMHRCGGGAPIGFRVGFWRGERTADVPVELPRRALRADEVDPPPPVVRSSSRAFLDPVALGRVPPGERESRDLPRPDPAAPGEGLELVNESETRVVVTVEGVAIGWVDAGARGLFVGLRPGVYRVATIRPLGALVSRPSLVPVPGRLVVGARRTRRVKN
jgi:hypothetical protein